MADAPPAPPPGLRPMRPIKRVPFVEEDLPLVGPPLADPNERAFASTPPAAAAASATSAAAPSFTSSFVAGEPTLAAPASVPSFGSTLASALPAAAALVSSPSAAGALGGVAPALGALAPALGGAAPILSKITSEAPAVEALIASPSAATALGAVAPALGAAAPDVAQYANPLLQTVASRDMNAPFGAMADRAAGIGQSHPAEDAKIWESVKSFAQTAAEKAAAARLAVVPALKSLGGAASEYLGLPALGAGAAKALGSGLTGVFVPSTPLNAGEDEAVRRMHESDPAWQEMLRRQKEDPTYSPLHDDPQTPPPHSLDPVSDDVPPDPMG